MDNRKMMEKVLVESRDAMLGDLNTFSKMEKGSQFQDWTYRVMRSVGEKYGMAIKESGPQSFPDIYYHDIGVEVKFTTGSSWTSVGNSILEGTRVKQVKDIYMYFGRKKPPDIKWREYDKCLYDIGVTHNPRYKIDMNINEGENIFYKMGISYNDFVAGNPIEMVKEHYRKILEPGEELWWLSDENEGNMSSLILSDFKKLNNMSIRAEGMALFPVVFSDKQDKFFLFSYYLLSEYNAVTSNLRDIFTSSGQKPITIGDASFTAPRIYYHLFNDAHKIKRFLVLDNVDKFNKYWFDYPQFRRLQSEEDIEGTWQEILDYVASRKGLPEEVKPSDIYRSGLVG